MGKQIKAGEKLPFFKYDTPYSAANSFRQLLAEHAPLVLVFMSNFGHPITRTFVGRYAATYDELTGGSLALVVRSRADRLARSVGPDTLPYPLLCDADGVLYDLLDIPTRSGALSTYSLEAWQIMRDAKRRGYHSPANGQQQLPLTLVLDKDGTVLFSHYGASLTDVPADCGAAQSLLEDLDVAKPVDVDDADVTIYADPGAAPDIPGLTPHVHEYAQPNLGETACSACLTTPIKTKSKQNKTRAPSAVLYHSWLGRGFLLLYRVLFTASLRPGWRKPPCGRNGPASRT